MIKTGNYGISIPCRTHYLRFGSFLSRTKISVICLLVLLTQFDIRAQDENPYFLNVSFYTGDNRILSNANSSDRIKFHSMIVEPSGSRVLPGLSMGYVKEYSGGRHSDGWNQYYVNDEVYYYIHPHFYVQGKYFGAVPGIIILTVLETEDGPDGLIFPSISLRLGDIDRFFLSADILHEIFFGLLAFNAHFLFEDRISKIMLGFTKSPGHDIGLSLELRIRIFDRFFAAGRAHIDQHDHQVYAQFGAGYVF